MRTVIALRVSTDAPRRALDLGGGGNRSGEQHKRLRARDLRPPNRRAQFPRSRPREAPDHGDYAYHVWINGVDVGQGAAWRVIDSWSVPANTLQPGPN